MCKILCFSNSSKLDIKKTSEATSKILLALERDGFGYAVQGAGNVFGEKCIAPKFTYRMDTTYQVKLPIVEKRQSSFGYAEKPIGPALFHGRTSTNDKGLLNCHPMQKDSWHLIHNGVVTDHGDKFAKKTTNDSEDLLHRLTLGIDQVEKHLTGYYAFAAISPDGNLHICRDDTASLFIAWAPKHATYVFGTTESLIEESCKALKIKIGPIDKVANNNYMIFKGNDLIADQTIKPRGWDSYHAGYASHSLGRSLGSYKGSYSAHDDDWYGSYNEKVTDIAEVTKNISELAEENTLLDELNDLDDSYTVTTPEGVKITVTEFYKLDIIAQDLCRIERSDGTILGESGFEGRIQA